MSLEQQIEETFLVEIHNYHTNTKMGTIDLARIAAKIALEFGQKCYEEGYDAACNHEQPSFKQFIQDYE